MGSSAPLPGVMTAPQISRKQSQETDRRPSAPLENEEPAERQRRELSPAKLLTIPGKQK